MSTSKLTVMVHVVGRASSRWRGASNEDIAAERNEKLSIERANTVGLLVKQQVTRGIPKAVVFLAGTVKGPTSPETIPVGITGVGSRNPLVPEDSDDNNMINRSAVVTLAFVKHDTTLATLWKPTAYLSLTPHWVLEVLRLDAAAIVTGVADLQIRLTNGINGKSRRYEARLTGKGFDNPLSIDPPKPPKLAAEKIHFTTGKPIGFSDYDKNNELGLWKLKVGPGIGIPKTKLKIGFNSEVTVLKFSGLGGNSDSVMIDSDVGWGPAAAGYHMNGKMKAIDKHPGDFIAGTEMYDEERAKERKWQDGLLVPFETGQSTMSDAMKTYVGDWALNWAKNLNVLLGMYGPAQYR